MEGLWENVKKASKPYNSQPTTDRRADRINALSWHLTHLSPPIQGAKADDPAVLIQAEDGLIET